MGQFRYPLLRRLSLPRAVSPRGWLYGLDRWPTLRWLELGAGNSPVDANDWRAILRLPGLEHLTVAASALVSVPRELVVAAPRRLALVGELPPDPVLVSLLRRFPRLSVLDLSESATDGRAVDLVPLSRLTGLKQLFVRRKTPLTGLDWATDLEVVEVG